MRNVIPPPRWFHEQKLDTCLWIGVENRAGEKKVGHLKPTGDTHGKRVWDFGKALEAIQLPQKINLSV